jgi:hypothetical protein
LSVANANLYVSVYPIGEGVDGRVILYMLLHEKVKCRRFLRLRIDLKFLDGV